MASLKEGVDYYIDEGTGYLVFTREYHLKRGFCCHSGCRHCPYRDAPSEDKPLPSKGPRED